MEDLPRLIADLKKTDASKEILKEVRRTFREPLPALRKEIKKVAKRDLPRRGGLGAWVAGTRVGAQIKLTGREVSLKIRGGRNSESKKRSDINAIDRGRLRHPSWGRRGPGQWHTQTVKPGFFSGTVEASRSEFVKSVEKGTNIVVERLNRG